MTTIIDYSVSRPNLDAVKALGHVGVMRYLSWRPNRKCITPAERDEILSRGLMLGLNWEFDEFDILQTDGVAHATEALRQARWLGYPAGCAIYFSGGDFDLRPGSHVNALRRYMRNVRGILGTEYRTGFYGGRFPLSVVFQENLADVGWQACVPWRWYQNGPRFPGNKSPLASAWQFHNGVKITGADVDINEVNPAKNLYIQGEEMPLTPEDIEKVANAVIAKLTTWPVLKTIGQATWDVDYIPSGREDNTLWQAKNALSQAMRKAEEAAGSPE